MEPSDNSLPELPRRWRRYRWWLALGVVLFVLFIGPWWHTWIEGPIPEQEELPPAELSTGPLEAGAASVEFTDLAIGRPLAGYGSRVFAPTEEVADPLFARALVVKAGSTRLAIVTADLLLFNSNLSGAVAKALQALDATWSETDLYFGATHTHSGPCGYAGAVAEQIALGWRDEELVVKLAGRIAGCIDQAARQMVAAELAHGAMEVDPAYIQNRTVPEDVANRWLDLLLVRERTDGKAIATVAIFSAHATARSSKDMRISADYPGVMTRQIESERGGTCLFLAGSVGSMKPSAPFPRAEWADALGTELASRGIEVAEAVTDYQSDVTVGLANGRVVLPTPQVKLTGSLRLSPFLATRLLPAAVRIQVLRLGDLLLLSTPADYSGVLALELRQSFPGFTAVATSFNGDYCGYILPESYYDLPKYEAESMCLYGRHSGELFMQQLRSLAASVTGPSELPVGTRSMRDEASR